MDRVLSESWFGLSLIEQIVSIGLEVRRAFRVEGNGNIKARDSLLDKAIKYTQLTIEDPKTPSSAAEELKISKDVLEDYKCKHFLDVSKEQILIITIISLYCCKTDLLGTKPRSGQSKEPLYSPETCGNDGKNYMRMA